MQENFALTEAVYYILLSLVTPSHGYAIMQNAKELSSGRVNLAAGTLYGALSSLTDKKWIRSLPSSGESRRKMYEITKEGCDVLSEEVKRLKELVKNGEKILEEIQK